ncbi:MAG: endonuclease domain-containing protein [Rothia mucilaginosa]
MPFREAVVLADSIMRRGLMEPREVTEILLSLTGYGGSAGPLLAQAVDASSESAGESLTRCLLMEHRLPLPVTQYPISCEGRNYRVDFAWPEARVILEFDGEQKYVDHPGRDRYEAARDRALTRAGWTVVHLTWADIFNKELEVVTHLRNLLLK